MNRVGVNNKLMNAKNLMTFDNRDGSVYTRMHPVQDSTVNNLRHNLSNNALNNQAILWSGSPREGNQNSVAGSLNGKGNNLFNVGQNGLHDNSPVTQTLSNSNRSSIGARSDSITFDTSNAVRTTISSSPEDSLSNQLNSSESNLIGMLGGIGIHNSQKITGVANYIILQIRC